MKKANNKSNVIKEMYWKILPVQYLSLIAACLCNIVNGIIIGNYLSSNSMAALGFVMPITIIVSALASIFASGAKIVCGRLIGRNENDKIKNIYSCVVFFTVLLAAIITFVTFYFADSISSLLGAKGELVELTSLYIKGLAIGFIPTMLVPNFMAFFQITNDNNISLISAIVLTICNLTFSLLNVNVFNGGLFGMGLSTSLAQLCSMIFLVTYIKLKKKILKFHKDYINKQDSVSVVKLGSPSALANVFYSIRNIVFNSQALSLAGTTAVSSLAIMNTSCGIFDSINIAQGTVVTMLASIFAGEKDKESLKKLYKISLLFGVIIGFVKIIIIYLFGRQFVTLFGAEGAVYEESYRLYVIYSLAMPVNMITVTMLAIYQSLEKVTFTNIMYALNAIGIPLFCCFALAPNMGIDIVWASYTLAEIVVVAFMYIYPLFKKKNPIKFEELFLLDSSFDGSNKMSITVKNIDDVVRVSKQVEEFCKSHNIDSKRSMMSGLCLEEIAGNVVEHGFTKSKKKNHSIEIFVQCENDEVSMRIRDDAPYFDPSTKLGAFNPDDPCKNIGIRLVNKVAKEMSYQTYFDMNVLSVKL